MNGFRDLGFILRQRPQAYANIAGGDKCPEIEGKVFFYQTDCGVVVAAEVNGLPHEEGNCWGRVFGFHIHSENTHYNPQNCSHPHHAGDMPPLFGNQGYGLQVFLTDRFDVEEVIGKTVVIHSGPDDFTSQPSGNAGEKIAGGIIKPV